MKILFALLLASAALAQTNIPIQVAGVTAQQAVLRYNAPDATACTVKVSESSSLSPLVHDVDTTIFASSDQDSRAESISTATQRTFVVGKRRAEQGTNGHWYSRSLQAFTPHWAQVSCLSGTYVGTVQFTTGNIALGNPVTDPLPADPAAGSKPAYAVTGYYAWPEFTKWDQVGDSTSRQESIIDPKRGSLIKRISMPQDSPLGYGYDGDQAFTVARSTSGNWTIPALPAVVTNTGAAATYTGTTQDWLALTDANIQFGGTSFTTNLVRDPTAFPLEGASVTITGSSPGAGSNAAIDVCVSVNQVNCWPSNATAIMQTQTLPSTTGAVTFGTGTPLMKDWTPAGYPALNRNDISARHGLANITSGGLMTWVNGGSFPTAYFNRNWAAGTHLLINGVSDCQLTSESSQQSIQLNLGTCSPSLTLPATATTWASSGWSFLIRKHTTSTDQINIMYANYHTVTSDGVAFTASGQDTLSS